MAPIFREVILEWEGVEYTCTPTFRLIQEIEQNFSIMGIANRMASGEPPVSHAAEVIARLLKHGGCAGVTAEDVYINLLNAETSPEDFVGLVNTTLEAFVPIAEKEPEKPSDPLATTAGKSKQKRKKRVPEQ